jgi:hypothetical protein
MPDFRSMYDSNYLYAFDLKGRDVTVTIKEVKAVKVTNAQKKEQKKPLVTFKESKDARGLVLCKTNGKSIAAMYGNDTDAWPGKRITLFAAMVDAFGATVEAIRIRPLIPKPSAKGGEFADAETMPAPEAPDHAELDESRQPGMEG